MPTCPLCQRDFDKQQQLAAHARWCPAKSRAPSSDPSSNEAAKDPAFVAQPVQLEAASPPAAEAVATPAEPPTRPAAIVQLPELRPPAPEQTPFVGRMPPPPRVGALRLVPVKIDGPDPSHEAEDAAAGSDAAGTPAASATTPATAPAAPSKPSLREPSQVAISSILELVLNRIWPSQPITPSEKEQLQAACDIILPRWAALPTVLAAIIVPRILMTPKVLDRIDKMLERMTAPAVTPASAKTPAAGTADAAPEPVRDDANGPQPAAERPLTPEEIAATYQQQNAARGVPEAKDAA